MSDLEDRVNERNLAFEELLDCLIRTEPKCNELMRSAVKDMLNASYPVKARLVQHIKDDEVMVSAFLLGEATVGLIGGTFSREKLAARRASMEWNKSRPRRVRDYVMKIAEIFPAEHLTELVTSSQMMNAVELIEFYEAVKGKAKQSDYAGKPSGIDTSKLYKKAKIKIITGKNLESNLSS